MRALENLWKRSKKNDVKLFVWCDEKKRVIVCARINNISQNENDGL